MADSFRGGAGGKDAYGRAGVDIDLGSAFARRIAPLARRTARRGAKAQIGGFGGLFDLSKTRFRDPVLVASSDGVGTKILLARDEAAWRAVGMDLVAMCANDLIAQGAEPLFFLDYMASGALDMRRGVAIMEGVSDACREAGCALIGGETAEMPDLYQKGEYDLAGFAVGAAERGRLLPSGEAREGDAILGLASNGVHANGFSLIRRIMKEAGAALEDAAPFQEGGSFRDILLAPTRLYVRPLLKILREEADGVRGLAHITGGGLTENVPRALGAKGLMAELNAASLPMPDIFRWLAARGSLSDAEMLRTFNCGIGMAVIADAARAEAITESLEDRGERVYALGAVRRAQEGLRIAFTNDLTRAALR